MSSFPPTAPHREGEDYVLAEVVPATEAEVPEGQFPLTPILLFLATCYTTYQVPGGGLMYAAGLLGILLCHEFGHYLQARWNRVSASLPYFIPMPIGPLGTMGAVIRMDSNMPNRKALFDIGISGPLAGLGPALLCSILGLYWSRVVDVRTLPPSEFALGVPLLFQFLVAWIHEPLTAFQTIDLHPLAYAGWVGIFITAVNLFPIGQLDGGHVLYAILRQKAHTVAWLVTAAAFAGVILTQNYGWSLMLMLILFIGPAHPPTANDEEPLGLGRTILGWATLLFLIIGFTPRPFV